MPQSKAPVPGTHRDVVGQPLGDAELPDLSGDLLPVARFGHANGCQVLTQAERGRSQQRHGERGAVGTHCRQLRGCREGPALPRGSCG